MLRLNSHQAYTEQNSVLVVRTQFAAIEIVRNRNNFNTNLPDEE